MNTRKQTAESVENVLLPSYEVAMIRAGFDFDADSEQFLTEHVLPYLQEMKDRFQKNDEEALDIYREAGLDEIKVRWRNFDMAKLNFFQSRRIRKIADEQVMLGDIQLHFVLLERVIYRHRAELEEKYGSPEIWITKG